jgi:hypothetical protein
MATMKVKHKGFPDPVTINEEDFDPAIHKQVADESEQKGADPASPPPNPELRGRLPEDFPGLAALNAFDPPIHTYAQARKAMKDDVKIPGIADATRAKIIAALAAKPEVDE